jgi:hypothetical protein
MVKRLKKAQQPLRALGLGQVYSWIGRKLHSSDTEFTINGFAQAERIELNSNVSHDLTIRLASHHMS